MNRLFVRKTIFKKSDDVSAAIDDIEKRVSEIERTVAKLVRDVDDLNKRIEPNTDSVYNDSATIQQEK